MKSDKNLPFLKVESVYKSFWNNRNEISVLRDVTFTIDEGEVVAIMGPSGIGKSTLLNLIGTLDTPDSGKIYFQGQNPFELPEKEFAKFRNTRIGFVFQFHHLLPEFTALENVIIPSIIYKTDMEKAEISAKEMLRRVGLEERINHRPSALSGGERQRVAVARALINNPLVVLADEPSGNLDLLNSKMLIDLLMEINRNSNKTFIIATHNPSIAERSHRVIYLK
ncbi:MAG: ABC transporter ATP-binding protein [Candidatus Marinimicrobia bacterium]|nr:ABC transporter ATP-binding protein [Candidatus Neomarinimicrobiota bacterium]MCK4446535.1 ABC transporter ATP-binding protein [Candidatus Neomarinimicrobiota bacterium]